MTQMNSLKSQEHAQEKSLMAAGPEEGREQHTAGLGLADANRCIYNGETAMSSWTAQGTTVDILRQTTMEANVKKSVHFNWITLLHSRN